VIIHKSVLTRFLSIKRGLASLYPVFIDLCRPLNLGGNEMWAITNKIQQFLNMATNVNGSEALAGFGTRNCTG